MRFLLVMVLALAAVVPSALITKVLMKRRGVDLPIHEAPKEYMKVGHPGVKAALIGLNFTIFGLILWGLYSL